MDLAGVDLPTSISLGPRVADLERIKQAKKKRIQQLKAWTIYDKQLEKEAKRLRKANGVGGKVSKHVNFEQSIVLLEAAARGDIDEVRRLLQQGVSPDVANEDGLTALHQCCIDNSAEMCKVLIDYHSNVNSRDTEMWTPLHAAATCGHIVICKMLVENGAELLSVNTDGNMPYDICEDEATLEYIETEMAKRDITQNHIDETRMLTEKKMLADMKDIAQQKGDLNYKDNLGATPLHVTSANSFLEVAHFLLQHRVPLDTLDSDGWQAIHVAACWGYPDMVELLCNYGANIDAKTTSGETVFDICADGEMHERLVQIKRDLEKLERLPRNAGLIRKRSSITNPRSISGSAGSFYDSSSSLHKERNPLSASIRRTSMREKSMLSWKEAKMEAQMRVSVQKDSTETEPVDEEQKSSAQSTTPTVTLTTSDVIVSIETPPPISFQDVAPNGKTNSPPSVSPANRSATLPVNSQTSPTRISSQPIKSTTLDRTDAYVVNGHVIDSKFIQQQPGVPPSVHVYASDPPLRHFKATNEEIVGGSEGKGACRCCSVM